MKMSWAHDVLLKTSTQQKTPTASEHIADAYAGMFFSVLHCEQCSLNF